MSFKLIVQEKLNNFRAMLRLVESPEFHECLTLNPNDQNLVHAVRNGDIDFVKSWVQAKMRSKITDYTARQLRHLAAGLGIKDYCSKTKLVLLTEIVSIQRAKALTAITESLSLEQADFNQVSD